VPDVDRAALDTYLEIAEEPDVHRHAKITPRNPVKLYGDGVLDSSREPRISPHTPDRHQEHDDRRALEIPRLSG
jgi:hypothetical protein